MVDVLIPSSNPISKTFFWALEKLETTKEAYATPANAIIPCEKQKFYFSFPSCTDPGKLFVTHKRASIVPFVMSYTEELVRQMSMNSLWNKSKADYCPILANYEIFEYITLNYYITLHVSRLLGRLCKCQWLTLTSDFEVWSGTKWRGPTKVNVIRKRKFPSRENRVGRPSLSIAWNILEKENQKTVY